MKRRSAKGIMLVTLLSASGVLLVVLAGCLRVSNGTWYFRNAPEPEGWPELTPVGEVEVKQYPAYRAALVAQGDIDGQGMQPMFTTLFDHIKRRDIPMTAPVDMGYAGVNDTLRMTSMAFLYRRPDRGEVGSDGAVRVEDLPPRLFASVGVRGGYHTDNFRKGLALLEAWLSANPAWEVAGPARYLGYNGPFVPSFARYGEVQLPVAAVGGDPQED